MSDNEKLSRIVLDQQARAATPHIPPDYIVNGECTLEALSRYLTIHPLDTIRAKEACKMGVWMNPVFAEQMAQPPVWGIRDIIGDLPAKEEE